MSVTGRKIQGPRWTLRSLTGEQLLGPGMNPFSHLTPGVYSFGLFTTTIFANAGQVVTGNPTPHFLSVCRPNYTALGCPPPSPDRPGPDRFVTDQGACAGSPSLVAAARRAFPCKDAALCAYAVTYTAVGAPKWRQGSWGRPAVRRPRGLGPPIPPRVRPRPVSLWLRPRAEALAPPLEFWSRPHLESRALVFDHASRPTNPASEGGYLLSQVYRLCPVKPSQLPTMSQVLVIGWVTR